MKSCAADAAPSSDVAVEVTNYLTMRHTKIVSNPLSFWCENQKTFPFLSQLAKLYMAASSSSVPVECMFSTTGLICNGKRCMIGPDKMNKVSFIHDNVKFLL